MSKTIEATFVSQWDEGNVETTCKVNLETLEVTDIEQSDDSENMINLLEETVEVTINGKYEIYHPAQKGDNYFIEESDKARLLAQVNA
ncbi:hypothetical protein DC914_RS24085 [Vibrio parahaemolyticus]|uniref:hypothetical protein n=1 Tax=Vibrio parahaemolyticus TaxID=670 RepID=UPI0006C09742|nr:hypothetical protein [Vibrio parahaemolyticus]EGR3228708.1 hypothetical protein [Vibrio parahaemolyticus]EJG0181118.1 hypothetical protein [Vibrio parahaemolyticus]KOY41452.1 hypothetical protein ACX10_01125 [Vibrio parahaemolyticus]MCS0114188.1 hypothetical protein [Vibrio parahaemolyticus]